MLCRFALPILFLSLPSSVFADDFGHWSEFVPDSHAAEAQVIVLGSPKDIQAISDKIETAQKADPEFFEQQQAQAKPGEALKYDTRLGISETEYKRLLEGAQELVMRPTGETNIEFSIDKLGLAVLSGLPIDAPHDELKYDLEQKTMYTAYGDLTTLARVAQDDVDAATGAWEGYQWNVAEQESEGDYTVVRFAIGKLRDKPRNMIYYDVNVARGGKVHQYHYILTYDSKQ